MVQTADKRTYKAIISLGTNLGDREKNLKDAKMLISSRVGQILLQSSTFNTVSWGNSDLNHFLNEVIAIEVTATPLAILNSFLAIEKELGRKRNSSDHYENRSLDIDLLYYDNLVLQTAELFIPHPRLHLRNFVLVPLAQILPNWLHPQLNKTSKQLLAECTDANKVELYT